MLDVNIIRKRRIRTLLDFDDCLLATSDLSRPIFRERFYTALCEKILALPVPLYDKVCATLNISERYLPWETFMEFSVKGGKEQGSPIRAWEILLEEDHKWSNEIFDAMIDDLVAAIKAGPAPDKEVAAAVHVLQDAGHEVYIMTHSHLRYCRPLMEFAGINIPEERTIDLLKMENKLKSTPVPYLDLRKREGEVDIENMADDSIANLRPLAAININGWFISEGEPHPEEHTPYYTFHHPHIIPALQAMALQQA